MEDTINKKEELTENNEGLKHQPESISAEHYDDVENISPTVNSTEEEKENKNDVPNNLTVEEKENKDEELKKLQDKISELNDKYLRLYSDFENFRRRIQKEKTDWLKYAGEEVIKNILPVLDDFERAIKHNQSIDDIDKLKEGFVLIYNKLLQTLKQKGLEPMECKGEVFNADFMEAVTQIPAPDEESKGKVLDEFEKGYKMHEKVIRLAKVVVGS